MNDQAASFDPSQIVKIIYQTQSDDRIVLALRDPLGMISRGIGLTEFGPTDIQWLIIIYEHEYKGLRRATQRQHQHLQRYQCRAGRTIIKT
jgi:hypothetical protein